MAVLNIRDVPEDVRRRLRIRAARAGRSVQAEVREILRQACLEEDPHSATAADLQRFVESLYRGRLPSGVVDELIRSRRSEAARE